MQKSTLSSNLEVIDLEFNNSTPKQLKDSSFYHDWPVVYVINSDKELYIGETYHAEKRMEQHLKNDVRKPLNHVQVFASKDFTKSATLDIESSLIELCAADLNPKRQLQNISGGLSRHNYANKSEFSQDSIMFSNIWKKLYNDGLVNEKYETLKNSDLFTYSPYKSLNDEQCTARDEIFIDIADCIEKNTKRTIVVNGSAGTGKSILAVYLMKLLVTRGAYLNDEGESETMPFIKDLKRIHNKKDHLEVAYVVAMTSFRSTLKKVFSKVKGLSADMVIGPSEVVKKHYDILIVDEAHRLKQPKSLGAEIGSMYETSKFLGKDYKCTTQLDWIMQQSDIQILFYDSSQTIKPSDVDINDFKKVISNCNYIELSSQMRCLGGNDYIKFVKNLLNQNETINKQEFNNYELLLFDNFNDLCNKIKEKEEKYQYSRIVSGYGFKWVSKNNNKLYDIEIDGRKLQWNRKQEAWALSINGNRVIEEVGCVHTIQGYDLNYCGVIFGDEIFMRDGKICVNKEKYYDTVGKKGIKDDNELLNYILNIYSVLMTRGIKGTYVYVCDKELRNYIRKYINNYENN